MVCFMAFSKIYCQKEWMDIVILLLSEKGWRLKWWCIVLRLLKFQYFIYLFMPCHNYWKLELYSSLYIHLCLWTFWLKLASFANSAHQIVEKLSWDYGSCIRCAPPISFISFVVGHFCFRIFPLSFFLSLFTLFASSQTPACSIIFPLYFFHHSSVFSLAFSKVERALACALVYNLLPG